MASIKIMDTNKYMMPVLSNLRTEEKLNLWVFFSPERWLFLFLMQSDHNSKSSLVLNVVQKTKQVGENTEQSRGEIFA